MTRRGCGCCKQGCKQTSARFDFDFYTAKSATSLNTRTLTLSEEVYRRVREYDPETGKRISTGPNEKVYEQEVPFTDEYMAGADPNGTVYAGNITVFGMDVQSRRIEVLDEQGRKIADRTYTGYLRANGSHNSQVALEYDFSDAYDFGVKNQYGYDRVAKLSLSKSSTGESGVPTSQRARTPAVPLASGYKADDFNGFNRDYSVDILLNYQWTRNETVTEGSGIDIHGFVSLTERPKNKEEFQNVIDAAGDPINTADIVPESDRKGTATRPNVIPGGSIENTQLEDQYYEHDITRIIPSGPNNHKSFLILKGETEGVMLRSTGTLNSYFQDSVISPPVTTIGKALAEVNDTDYEITPRLYVDDRFLGSVGDFFNPADNGVAGNNGNTTTIRYSRNENVDYDGNWRKNGWVKVGLNSYEYTKGLKPDNEIDFAYLIERDLFSFNYRDYVLGERDNKLKVEFLNSDGEVEFTQVFERGVQKLSEDVDSNEILNASGIDFVRANKYVEGTNLQYRGLIDGNFNVHKYQSENNDYAETNFWLPQWGEHASQRLSLDAVTSGGWDATSSGRFLFGPLEGIYRTTSDGRIKTPNIDYFNGDSNLVDDFFWFMQLEVPVKEGGLYYLPSNISVPTLAKRFKLQDTQWSSSDKVLYDIDPTYGYGGSLEPRLNLGSDELDYVDDLARYYVKTSGDFAEGNLMSLSDNAGDGYGGVGFQGNSINTCWDYADFGDVDVPSGADLAFLSAGANTLLRESLKAGLRPVLDADTSFNSSLPFLMTAIRSKEAASSLALGRDIGQNKYQELFNSIAQKSEGDVLVIPVKTNWRQSYSSDIRRAADGSFMRMRFRESHAEIGSFHDIDLTTFDYSVGNRWNYKPVAWPEDYSFSGFAKVRFTIISDDTVPRYIQTNGTSKWEQVPDYTKKDHDKKYDADQLCARGECYHFEPYSTLNYKVASVDFGASGFELAPETSVSYAGCGAVFNHSLKKLMDKEFDGHVLVTRGFEQSRGVYHASNAANANTGSFGHKIGSPFNDATIDVTIANRPTGAFDGFYYGDHVGMFDVEGYQPKEEYLVGGGFNGGLLTVGTPTGTVDNVFVSNCWARENGEGYCEVKYATAYSMDAKEGDIIFIAALKETELGPADSVTEVNGGDCSSLSGPAHRFLKSAEYIGVTNDIQSARQLHTGVETVSVASSVKAQYGGEKSLPKNIGMTMDLRTEVKLEDPENEVGPIKSVKLTAEVNWETLRIRKTQFSGPSGTTSRIMMSQSYPQLSSDYSSNLLGVSIKSLSLPSSYSNPCTASSSSGGAGTNVTCRSGTEWSVKSGEYNNCDAFDPDREDVGAGSRETCEPVSTLYTTIVGQVEYDPPEEYTTSFGSTAYASYGPITPGDPLNVSSMSLTYQDKYTSYGTVCYEVSQAISAETSSYSWFGEAELPLDFDPLNPPDVSITFDSAEYTSIRPLYTRVEASNVQEVHEEDRRVSDREYFLCDSPIGKQGFVGGDERYVFNEADAVDLTFIEHGATISLSDIVINLTKREY